jgi:hypothetical protein
MNLFMYGLEFSVLGFAVVLVALFGLALILLLFNKIFTGRESTPKQGKGGKGAPVKNQPVKAKNEPAYAVPLKGEKPEIVAAAMGALLFALDGGQGRRFSVTKVARAGGGGMSGNWGQTGRSRLLQLRQDFVLSKRGKVR